MYGQNTDSVTHKQNTKLVDTIAYCASATLMVTSALIISVVSKCLPKIIDRIIDIYHAMQYTSHVNTIIVCTQSMRDMYEGQNDTYTTTKSQTNIEDATVATLEIQPEEIYPNHRRIMQKHHVIEV